MKIVLYIVSAIMISTAVAADKAQEPAEVRLEEGFFVDGLEGVLAKEASGDTWHFRPAEAISVPRKDYPADKPLPMLPCSVLDQMTQMAGTESTLRVRLWAMAMLYRHSNYLYAVFFVPLQNTAGAAQQTTAGSEPPSQPDEDSIIPLEILQQMKDNQAPDLRRFQQVAQVTGDMNLIGRSGYLQEQGKNKMFVPDAFGMNVELARYTLLPSAAMEAAEKQMNKTPGRQRYSVSGLVTTYKGKTYILLRRAERTFTHGNFTQ